MRRIVALGVLVTGAALAACGSATSKSEFEPPSGSAGSGSTTAAGAAGAAGATSGGKGGGFTSGGMAGTSQSGGFQSGGSAGTSPTGGAGGNAQCAGVTQKADQQKLPADIIWAIDTSGSMDTETKSVQQKMNAFAAGILQTGIDVHVVLIAEPPSCVPIFNICTGMCLPAPLGSGQCPGDSKAPYYLHVPETVASTDALLVIKDTYPKWKQMLRPNSVKHIVVVTDDNASSAPYGTIGDVPTWIKDMTAQDPATLTGFKLSSIYCFSKCPAAATEGTQWRELVKQTGGVQGDLCKQDFQPVFNELAKAIVTGAQLSCTWKIPAPPMGQTFDPAKVNVEYHSGGTVDQIGFAKSLADCGPTKGGWYYDNPAAPTAVLACPATCQKIQADPAGEVNLSFGCETRVIEPE